MTFQQSLDDWTTVNDLAPREKEQPPSGNSDDLQ